MQNDIERRETEELGHVRKLGLIGGMSWISTRAYYEKINRRVQKLGQAVASAPMVIESLDYAPIYQAKQADDWSVLETILVDTARRLTACGAEGIAIASNVMHKLYDEVSAAIDVPVLHIADAVGEHLADAEIGNAALLGTRAVMTEGFYRQRLVGHGLSLLAPDMNDVELVDGIIYKELILGRVTRDAERALKTIVTSKDKAGADAIILASTELELVVDTRANVLPVYDSTEIHCNAISDWILAGD